MSFQLRMNENAKWHCTSQGAVLHSSAKAQETRHVRLFNSRMLNVQWMDLAAL